MKNSRKGHRAVENNSRKNRPARRRKPRRGAPVNLMAYAEEQKANKATVDRILAYYRPLKKPVTLRLDADVLAWFKKGGRRYQTRINLALRKVMEREMKQAGT